MKRKKAEYENRQLMTKYTDKVVLKRVQRFEKESIRKGIHYEHQPTIVATTLPMREDQN